MVPLPTSGRHFTGNAPDLIDLIEVIQLETLTVLILLKQLHLPLKLINLSHLCVRYVTLSHRCSHYLLSLLHHSILEDVFVFTYILDR